MKLKTFNKWVLSAQILFFVWMAFIVWLLIVNRAAPRYFLYCIGPQALLFIASFFYLRLSGIILLIAALIIGIVVLPLGRYGLFALIQCLVLLSGPPLLFGIIFLTQSNRRSVLQNPHTEACSNQ